MVTPKVPTPRRLRALSKVLSKRQRASVSIALWTKVEDLAKRVATLEQMLATSRKDPAFRRNNAARRVEGDKLRAAIEGILAAHPDYSAKHVLKALAAVDLGRQALPSVRTVQWHIKALRKTSRIARAEGSPGIALG